MAINFTYYPTSNRVPGVYVEMDPSQANTATVLQNSLLIGQMLPSGSATPDEPLLIESQAQILTALGSGSMLASMASRYVQRDPFGPCYVLPLKDNSAGEAAEGEITLSGTATANGTLNIYIAGTRVQAGVTSGDTGAVAAASLKSAIDATLGLVVNSGTIDNSGTVGSVIPLTANNAGQAGNDIDLQQNYLGTAGGEFPVPGLAVSFTPFDGGTANPDFSNALGNLSSTAFDFICLPYNDTASLNLMKDFLADDVGRWSWEQMIYGGCFTAFRGTLGECTTFGLSRNDQHMSAMAFNGSPDPEWIWATEITAACAASLRVDPGLPLQYINTTLQAPPIPDQWTLGERNTLLYDGMSTTRVGDDGTVILERMTTTYQKNAAGAPDNSYLDVETMYGLMFVARNMADYLLTRYARKKLVSDTTVILYGSNCVNAPMIKASVIANYRALEQQGYVQNSTTFAQNVIVENAGNGLVKILAPVDLVNQLRQIAILLQFTKS
jgi:phage tail sheath gpL-like